MTDRKQNEPETDSAWITEAEAALDSVDPEEAKRKFGTKRWRKKTG